MTVTAIKADIGGIGGHTRPSDGLIESVRNHVVSHLQELLIDCYVGYAGDDIHIIMTHTLGVGKIHKDLQSCVGRLHRRNKSCERAGTIRCRSGFA